MLFRSTAKHCGVVVEAPSGATRATGSSSRHDGLAAVGRGRAFRAFKACFLSDQGLRCMAGRPHAHEGVGAVGQILRPLSAVDRIKCLTGVDDGRDDAPAPQTTGRRFGDRVNPGGQPPQRGFFTSVAWCCPMGGPCWETARSAGSWIRFANPTRFRSPRLATGGGERNRNPGAPPCTPPHPERAHSRRPLPRFPPASPPAPGANTAIGRSAPTQASSAKSGLRSAGAMPPSSRLTPMCA